MRAVPAILIALMAAPAGAADYAAPDLSAYYEALRQPDNAAASCCGAADAYYADHVAPCTAADGAACALIAIITDTRPNRRTLPDGRIIDRPPVAPGTRIVIPRHKLRRPPQANPTDHNVVFLSAAGAVFCWEPLSGL